MEQLSGRVAVITGAGGGIGLATGRLCAQQGMKVVLADVDRDRLEAAVAGCRSDGLEVTGVPTDVSSFAAMTALARRAYDTYGAVHLLHLNAGTSSSASLFDDETASWERAVGVNLMGVIWGIKAFVGRMVAAGEEGIVLATSSGSGTDGTTYQSPAYSATKNAVVSVMECLHGQLRDREAAIRAAVVFPPLTATNLAGNPETMIHVERMLNHRGVPAVLVAPEGVAEMIVDGVRQGRFFIRVGPSENERFFHGAHGEDYFAWNGAMVRGRAEALLNEGRPDPYLW